MRPVRPTDTEAGVIQQRLVWTPQAKQRPRTTYKNGRPRTFTPRETVAAEGNLRLQWEGQPVLGPIEVELLLADEWVQVTVNPSPPPDGKLIQRGDIDNYLKLVMDALNGTAWKDDRQIVALFGKKM